MKKDLYSGDANRVRNLYLCPAVLHDSGARPEPFVDRRAEGVHIVLLREDQLAEAEGFLASCEACSEFGDVTFDYLLDAITGIDPSSTEYLLPRPAKCPCGHAVTEKTLVSPV